MAQGDATDARGSGDDASSCVLDQLGFVEEFVRGLKRRRALQEGQKEATREWKRIPVMRGARKGRRRLIFLRWK